MTIVKGETLDELMLNLAVADAYKAGLAMADHRALACDSHVTRNHSEFEMRLAVKNWREAASDHGHTSYYGAHRIRCFRAYWLGALRAKRGEA